MSPLSDSLHPYTFLLSLWGLQVSPVTNIQLFLARSPPWLSYLSAPPALRAWPGNGKFPAPLQGLMQGSPWTCTDSPVGKQVGARQPGGRKNQPSMNGAKWHPGSGREQGWRPLRPRGSRKEACFPVSGGQRGDIGGRSRARGP